jgi:hypothetical protein
VVLALDDSSSMADNHSKEVSIIVYFFYNLDAFTKNAMCAITFITKGGAHDCFRTLLLGLFD